jgi:hypothetical protein
MTDKQKLQQLFDAALKAPTDFNAVTPQRAFPTPVLDVMPAPASVERIEPAPPAATLMTAVDEVTADAPSKAPTMAAVLDDAASAELAVLLDEQIRRKKRRHRMEALVTAVVLLGSVGGGSAWFVQSPQRVAAFKEAMRDIRSVGDVKSLVAKYQNALDRVAARSQQIDQATAAMGVKPSDGTEEDPYFDAEMKQMMGGKGKTVGDRNRALQKNFADMAKENGGEPKATLSALKKEQSFDWGN